jgi:hypothetical protein
MYSAGDLPKEGLPHSDIRGSTIARISPRLFAACHVLHRLLAPRHPPNALVSLTIQPPKRPHAVPNRAQTSQCSHSKPYAYPTLHFHSQIHLSKITRQGQVHRPGATCGGFGSTRPSGPEAKGHIRRADSHRAARQCRAGRASKSLACRQANPAGFSRSNAAGKWRQTDSNR